MMSFQKIVWMGGGLVGCCELYPSLFWIFGICLTLQSPLATRPLFISMFLCRRRFYSDLRCSKKLGASEFLGGQ